MVLLWHQISAAEQRTTLIVLFEDGSLRIYMANLDATNFWLRPAAPVPAIGFGAAVARTERKKRPPKAGKLINNFINLNY